MNLQQRLDPYEIVKRHDCESMKDLFSDIKVISKTSLSDSVLFTALIQNIPVIVKASFPDVEGAERKKKMDESEYPDLRNGEVPPLLAEQRVYQYVTKLVRERVSPHFVVSYGSFKCHLFDLAIQMPPLEYRALADKVNVIFKKKEKLRFPDRSERVRMLILEKAQGMNLQDWVQEKTTTDDMVMIVLFQIIYSLHILQKRGVRHGDLHIGNVIIDQYRSNDATIAYFPETVSIYANSERSSMRDLPLRFFEIPHYGWMAKIFDWDQGGIYARDSKFLLKNELPGQVVPFHNPPIKNTKAENECHQFSACGHNQRADLFTLLSNLHVLLSYEKPGRYPKVRAFIKESIDSRLLDFASPSSPDGFAASNGFEFRLCAGPIRENSCPLTTQDTTSWKTDEMCSKKWDPPSCWMMSPIEILNSCPYFLQYQKWYPMQKVTTKDVYGDWNNIHSRVLLSLPSVPLSNTKKGHEKKLKSMGLF